MIRQQAFVDSKTMLKGGLHCHTTRSDGHMSPEEVIAVFKENGYDFLAITDHRKYNYANYSSKKELTIIPGMEFDNSFDHGNGMRFFHTVCIGPTREQGNGYQQDETMPSGAATTQEEFQAYLDEIHARNNLTIYCHPQWSATSAKYFEKLTGNFAMEIWNTVCAVEHDVDTDAAYWDELLGQNIRIYGVATDDVHREQHCCRGWVMVNAENDIAHILCALEEGKFYSSCGPEIYDFYVDGDKAVVKCSPAAKVRLHSDKHQPHIIRSTTGDMTCVEFKLDHWCGPYSYVRATVIDEQGRYAWTNPIFL